MLLHINQRHILITFLLTAYSIVSAASTEKLSEGIAPCDSYYQIETFNYIEPVSIHAMTNDWQGHLDSGENALSKRKISWGVNYENIWGYGWFGREDYFLTFSEDSALIYHQNANDLAIAQNRSHDLLIKVQHARSLGFQFFYQTPPLPLFKNPNNKLSAKLVVNLMVSDQMIEGKIWGNASTSDDDYDITAFVDYFYDKDELFGRPLEEDPFGFGSSVDLYIFWDYKSWQFTFAALDAYYRVKWKDAPFTEARISTNTKGFDENGFARFDPVLSGIEGNQDYVQSLPLDLYLTARYHLPKYSIFIEHHNINSLDFNKLGIAFKSKRPIEYQLAFQTRSKAFSFATQYKSQRIGIGLNHFDKKKIKTIELFLQLYF